MIDLSVPESAGTWALFVASEGREVLDRIARTSDGRLNEYVIREVVRVVGEPPSGIRQGWRMLRIENDAPITFGGSRLAKDSTVAYNGVTQHSHYATEIQRRELDLRSHGEFEPSNETTSVLIPIGKSTQWWQLAQDVRQAYFTQTETKEGHAAIGLRYVDLVYRKLYHSRYMDASVHYDFLTYFEFRSSHCDDFKELLAELRDTERNPEWAYVGLEYEIWMTKLS
jgi:hypothetical protein